MPRLRLRDFSKGLWLSGPADATPTGGLRRMRGVHAVKTGSLRSRWGAANIFAGGTPHSLIRFADVRVAGVGTTLTFNAVQIITGLSGERLAFVRMPPVAGIEDYLFVTGGGLLRKVQATGQVTTWGIAAPTTTPVATPLAALVKPIDAFDSAASWTDANANLDLKADEATIKLEGTNSLKIRVLPGTTGGVTKALSPNLSRFVTPIQSPDEDWISLAVRFEKPGRVESMQIIFGLDSNFNTTYTKEIIIDDQVSRSRVLRPTGIADLAGVHGDEQTFMASFSSQPFKLNAAELLGITRASEIEDTWSVLLLPKSSFVRAGLPTGGWASVTNVKVLVKAAAGTSKAVVYLDDLKMVGGVGMQGTYKWKETFKRSVTGTRSNGGPVVTSRDHFRFGATIVGAPAAEADPQADRRELWRTLGNGEIFFKSKEQAIAVETWTDEVADYEGLHSINGGVSSDVLVAEELPDDNDPPAVTYGDAFGPFDARMLWTRDSAAGARGRIYYSPVGRAEAVEGFLIATNDDDPLQRGVIWDGRAWAFSEGHLFEVVGTDVLTVREVFGVPGTASPFTVCPTPYGIIYLATDGLRLFDGNTSRLVGFDAVGVLFRGEAAEGLTPFEPVVAAYHNGEVFMSDEAQALAYHVADGTWRDLGFGFASLAHEADTGLLIVGAGNRVLSWEAEGTLVDRTGSIPFVVEPGHVFTGAGELGLVQRLYFDVQTNGQVLSAVLILDGIERALPPITTGASRRVIEVPVMRPARVIGVRLFGSLTDRVEVFGIEADVHAAGSGVKALAR